MAETPKTYRGTAAAGCCTRTRADLTERRPRRTGGFAVAETRTISFFIAPRVIIFVVIVELSRTACDCSLCSVASPPPLPANVKRARASAYRRRIRVSRRVSNRFPVCVPRFRQTRRLHPVRSGRCRARRLRTTRGPRTVRGRATNGRTDGLGFGRVERAVFYGGCVRRVYCP